MLHVDSLLIVMCMQVAGRPIHPPINQDKMKMLHVKDELRLFLSDLTEVNALATLSLFQLTIM